jgi:hypothetical protein
MLNDSPQFSANFNIFSRRRAANLRQQRSLKARDEQQGENDQAIPTAVDPRDRTMLEEGLATIT